MLSFDASGIVFVQSGGTYGTNAAGVVVVPGSLPTQTAGTFNLVAGSSTIDYGALTLAIVGLGPVQLFPANAGNGAGSATPSQNLHFSGTLQSLFGSFSTLVNPTFTFSIGDGATTFSDNSGSFGVDNASISGSDINGGSGNGSGSGNGGGPGGVGVPLPAAAWQSLAGLLGVIILFRKNMPKMI